MLAAGGRCVVAANGAGHLASLRTAVEAAVNYPGWEWAEQLAEAFSLESGSRQLAVRFDDVRFVRPTEPGRAVVTAPDVQQFEGLARDFARRQDQETAGVEALFDQLAATLSQALTAAPNLRQLTFDDLDLTERQQLERDRRAWQERLEGLETERRRELDAVGRRFAGARNLVFPFAVALCTQGRPR
ncbi:MAG: hypothetical protein ACRDWW_06655 [Acidimicrobiales bacterium]